MPRFKLIVSNLSALKKKYGAPWLESQDFTGARDALIAADNNQGIVSQVVFLDDANALGAAAVTDAKDEKQNKDALDAAYKLYNKPYYILLLGSVDIIPHQTLKDLFYDPGPEDEPYVPSDLPYACDAPYSKNICPDFINPSRIVGRLPDITGAPGDKKYFLDVLANAANRKARPRADFEKYFALCSDGYKKSTELTLQNIFGDAGKLQVCPPNPEAAEWTPDQMGSYTHFGNCHGFHQTPKFYGTGIDYVILDSEKIASAGLSPGMIASFEACYGAQLYDPKLAGNTISICNAYLRGGCAAYFGSSGIAYGGYNKNNNADLITRYFLKYMLEGYSSGHACLKARQDFVTYQKGQMIPPIFHLISPMAQKTLAQFNLMGDPSIAPVQPPSGGLRYWMDAGDSHRFRLRTEDRTHEISNNCHWSERLGGHALPHNIETKIKILSAQHPGAKLTVSSFQVHGPKSFIPIPGLHGPTRVHIVSFNLSTDRDRASRPRIVAYEIVEADGKLLDISVSYSKSF